MSDIQDEAYTELCEENQRLRELVTDTRSGLLKELGDAQAEIEQLKTLAREFEQAAGNLVEELAGMHGALFTLIASLHNTRLTTGQSELIDAAKNELCKSQQKFFATYGDMVGGAAPERN